MMLDDVKWMAEDGIADRDWRVRGIVCARQAHTGASLVDTVDPELLEEGVAKGLGG